MQGRLGISLTPFASLRTSKLCARCHPVAQGLAFRSGDAVGAGSPAPPLSTGDDDDLPADGRRPDRHGLCLTHRASVAVLGRGVHQSPLALGIAFELGLAAAIIYLPVFNELLGTAPLPASDLLILLPFPFIVWGADEIRRWFVRRATPTR
jgi:hypothetical protein